MPNIILQGFNDTQFLITQGYTPLVAVVRYAGAVWQNSPTTVRLVVNTATGFLGADPAVTVAVGDTLAFDLLVELA